MLNYQRAGNGPVLVLLHGLFGSLENLNSIKRALQNDYDVICVDLPDHGSSPHSSRFSFQHYVDQVEALLDALSIERCHLLGHSLGGKIAMLVALQHPKRVDRLIVADIAPSAYPPGHTRVLAGLNAVTLDSLSSRSDADRQMAEHINEPGVRQFLLKSLFQGAQGWQWRFNLSVLERDYQAIIDWPQTDKLFEGPTLFIKGGNSDYITSAHQSIISEHFPKARGRIIQGAGHWLHAEKPAAFNNTVADFLAG